MKDSDHFIIGHLISDRKCQPMPDALGFALYALSFNKHYL